MTKAEILDRLTELSMAPLVFAVDVRLHRSHLKDLGTEIRVHLIDAPAETELRALDRKTRLPDPKG